MENNFDPQTGQPLYGQQPQYQNNVQPQKNAGTTLCIVSILCRVLSPFVCLILGRFLGSGDISSRNGSVMASIFLIYVAAYIASWILAIIARVKYKSKFGLVLLIIYGALIVLGIIGIFAFLYWIGSNF